MDRRRGSGLTRVARRIAAVFVVVGAAAPAAGVAQTPAPAARPHSLHDSVFTAVQAERGARVFRDVCAACHEAAAFTALAFRQAWNGRPVSELYRLIRSTMPHDNPGRLRERAYADVLAYVFALNGLPAGERELPTGDDLLAAIRMDLPLDSTAAVPRDAAPRGRGSR